MTTMLALLALLSLCVCDTKGLIQFLQEPSDVIVRPSDPLWWHCTARLAGTTTALTYLWSKEGQLLNTPNSNIEKFQNGTLHLREVGSEDIGTYQCRAQGGGEIAYSQTATLSLAALAAAFATNPSSGNVNLGNSLMLQCSIESNPPATISWQHNGDPVQGSDVTIATQVIDIQTESRLSIPSVEHRHGGQYRCLATNSLLEGQTRYSESATVVLVGRPGFVTLPSPQIAIIGSSVTFLCATTTTPAATIQWLDPAENIIQSSQRFLVSGGSVRINDVQLNDQGYYTCTATNEYGTNTAVAILTVTSTFEPVVFTRTPVDQTVVVGGRLTFACEADGIPTPSVTWSKSDGSLSPSRTSEPAPGWLRINQVEANDAGIYICTASNGLSTSSRSVTLTVQEQPQFIIVPDDVTILEGESITLECQAEGNPQPEISWTTPVASLGTIQSPSKPTATVEVAENGSLILSSIQREYTGIFTCLASNSISTINTEATVTVHGPPIITQAPQDVTTVEGSTVTFTCRAAAVPAVTTVSWVFQSEQLSTNLKYEVFGNGDLRINNVEKSQEGMYSCQAVNSVGESDVKTAFLTVMVPPKFETQPSDHTLEVGSNVTLHCEASGDPTPTLEWVKDDEELILSDNVILLTNFSLVITDLQKENTGRYQCIASNTAGTSQATAVVMTPDIPEFSSPAENITANQSQSVSLSCRASAREAPTIRWYTSDDDGTKREQIGLGRNDPGSQGFLALIGTDGDLNINLVSLNDEGWYLCEAENSAGSQEKLIYLSVNYPASVVGTSQLSGEDSSQIILTCNMNGKPPPSATWFLPTGEPVVAMANKYFINNRDLTSYLVIYQPEVKFHDGDFICEAQNSLGSSTSTVTVSIEGVPVIVEVLANPSLSSVILRCLSKGAPTPETSWYRDGVRANTVAQHSVQSDDALVVTDLEAARVGQYECQLENKYGSVSASLQAPGQPSTPLINTITAKSISISWMTPAPVSNLSVASYSVYYHLLGNISSVHAGTTGDTSMTVSGLKPYTGYHFSVQARNGLGTGTTSDFSQLIFTAEDVPGAVRDVSVEAVGSSILVSWEEPEELNGNPMHIVYEILYGPINISVSSHMTYVKTNDGANVHLLADLEPAVSYRVALRTGNTYLGVWSEAVIKNSVTGYPAPVSILQGFTLLPTNGTNSIMVMWRPINPPAFLAYIIRYRDTHSGEVFDDIIITSSEMSWYLLMFLNAGTEYAVKMTYETQGGVAPFTNELFANLTKESLPEPSPRDRGSYMVIIGGVLGGLLLVLLVLLLVILYIRWKRSKDDFQPSPVFDPDSLWINRRFSYGDTLSLNSTVDDSGSEKKGTYEVAIVNENYDPGDTLMSNDSAYDLGKTDVAGPSGGHLVSDGIKPEKKKKRKKKRDDDLIYKNPSNPDVVLVKKAVLGEDTLPPQPVSSQGILSEDEGTPNTTAELTNLDSTQNSSIAEFPVFPNADDSIRLAGDDAVFKDNKTQEMMNKKTLDSLKRRQRQEQKERDRDFDIGYRNKTSILDSIRDKFSRRKSSLDEIPGGEIDMILSSGGKHGETAVLY